MINDEDIGLIKGQLQSIERRLQNMEEGNKEEAAKLDTLTKEMAMYRHFVVWVRSSLLIAAFLITMKWGDLMNWFNGNSGD